jgi:flagellar hook-associated protein 1
MSTSSLNSSLLIATSGLKAAQAGLDVVSRNVANSGVEGYTRKQAPLSSVVVGERGAGVRTLEIIRNVNKTILTQFQNATSSTQRYSVEDDFLARFEASFGAPGDDANISAKLGNLHNAMTALTISPDNATAQAQALSKAQAVVSDLNQVAANARALREEADSKIADSVNAVNTALIQIDDLNRQIQTLKAQSRSTADLEDQRDIQIGIVAKEMDITTSHQTTGAIFVSTRSGRALVDSTFSSTNLPLSFTSTPVILGSTAYYPPPSASYSGLSGVMLHGTDITSEIQGGRIGAYVNVRDDYMPETLSQMDELAGRLIQSFNFQDLQLFQAGTTTLPSALASTNARTSGQGVLAATPITVSSTTGLSAGMTVKFDNQSTVYEITSVINGTDFTIAQVGGTGGLTAAISNTTNIMFGPKLPQLTVGGSAYAVGAGSGSPATNVITLANAVGAQVGMRIQFANHSTTYTVTAVTNTLGAGEQITLQPDGGASTSGLLAAVSAGERIKVLPPVTGLVGTSTSMQLNPNVVNNPWRMRDGTRVQSPSTLTGDNTLPTAIINMMGTQLTFSSNTGLATTATLENFAASGVAFQANRRATTIASLESQNVIYNNFKQRTQNESGVNVDEELAFMLQVQNSYTASARTITALKDMMDTLLQIVR